MGLEDPLKTAKGRLKAELEALKEKQRALLKKKKQIEKEIKGEK